MAPVIEVNLSDGRFCNEIQRDTFLQHNAFRSPGAASGDDLRARLPKVTYLKNIYAKMHRGIIDHPVYLDAANVEELRAMILFSCASIRIAPRS